VVDIVRRYSATPAAAVELAKLKSGGVSQNMLHDTTTNSQETAVACLQAKAHAVLEPTASSSTQTHRGNLMALPKTPTSPKCGVHSGHVAREADVVLAQIANGRTAISITLRRQCVLPDPCFRSNCRITNLDNVLSVHCHYCQTDKEDHGWIQS